jgi:hypothetical protein
MNTITTGCTYSNPVRYDGLAPTLPTHDFYFKNSVCTVSETATSTAGAVTFNGYNPTTTIASSSDIQIYGSISAGELLVSLFLFLLLWIKLIELIAGGLDKLKTKKKFLGYNGGDVEIRDDY